ncbi:MAG: hypothetical protein DMF70_08180 [Acidobacteria bacterium]|nr:MAG: hypothetical protein DMF70_08180 [Acidobacteriota bacterium]
MGATEDRLMERESLEMDVVFVGAGPANLSGALHLARLVSDHNDGVANGKREEKPLGDIQIAVIEKGATVGAHILSGAVMDPRGLAELIPDFVERGAPLETPSGAPRSKLLLTKITFFT